MDAAQKPTPKCLCGLCTFAESRGEAPPHAVPTLRPAWDLDKFARVMADGAPAEAGRLRSIGPGPDSGVRFTFRGR